MHSYRLESFCKKRSPKKTQAFMDKVRELQQASGSRAAEDLFVKTVGVYPIETQNEPYYADMVNFSLASLMAYAGRDAEASEILSKTEILPSGTRNWMLSDHTRLALELFPRYMKAREAGLPHILMTALPKSASLSLTNTLCELMDIPYFCLSLGHFPNHALIEKWLNYLAAGGMTCHEHFAATPHTISILKKIGFSRIVVQTRDPRASLWSMVNMQLGEGKHADTKSALKTLLRDYYPEAIKWIQGWINAGKNNPWLTIDWVFFRDYARDPWGVIARILDPYKDMSSMQQVMVKLREKQIAAADTVKSHFHTGNNEAWREHIPAKIHAKLWEQLTPEVITLLSLKK